MEVAIIFLVAGLIILIGFLGSLSFEKTRIPDVLMLLGIGVILGPVLKLVEPQTLNDFAGYFGLFALMIILFEGGMDIDIDKLLKEFGTASILVIISFVLSTLSIAAFLHFIHGWDIIRSLLLGTILGCTSAAIVIPIISKMSLKGEVKTLLSIESILSDVFAVVFTISLIEFVKLEKIGINAPFRAIASSFSIALIAGVASGLAWLKVLDYFKGRKYSYMTTLSAMLIIFALVDFLGGSGPIAILLFGIILGNSHDLVKILKLKANVFVDETIKSFHGEMTFFIRTFFFVYMGMMLTFKSMNLEFMVFGLILVLIIIIVRLISVYAISIIFHEKKSDRFIMLSMLPRGLASAVLATLPVSANVRGCDDFVDTTFMVIILTNILMTIGVFFVEKQISLKSAS
jgi:cell volume regulation protein A